MKRIHLFLLLFLECIATSYACTAVIASGKVTTDGRPFIFKNRDAADGIDNSLITLKGTKYQYVGVVNYSTSSSPTSIWYGHNEAGFAILNTLSYYFNSATSKANTSAGALMKKALGQCATVAEFEALLQQTQQQTSSLTLSTNFAVMDTLGNVAFFETSNRSYTKFDVNDPAVAPDGYLVRTNFSFTSPYYDTTNHVGEQRYKAACKYMEDTFGGGKIDAVRMAHEMPRYLYHGDTQVNLWNEMPAYADDMRHIYFSNFIPRFTSASASLMQGILPGEDPTHTVSWIAIGWPCGSFTVPIVITPSLTLPEVVKRQPSTYKSEMCSKAVTLKNSVFAIYHDGEQATDSIILAKLINGEQTGVLQKMTAADNVVWQQGADMMQQLRAGTLTQTDVANFYAWVDTYWRQTYNEVVTSVKTITQPTATDKDKAYYSLDGSRHKFRPGTPGVYVHRHRKVIVR